jgi:phosphoribosylformylglycinamidine synthase
MRVYKGVSALSDFRKAKLLQQLKAIDKNIHNIEAEHVHFADITGELSVEEDDRLRQLLTYGLAANADRRGEMFLVVPRAGTISPWSSKATDIARDSGLEKVNRIERGTMYYLQTSDPTNRDYINPLLHDRMTENVLASIDEASGLFAEAEPRMLEMIDVLKEGITALKKANKSLGLALSDDEIEYLSQTYLDLKRNPTDAELMMFAQVNSEHCRHKIFNADWVIDGKKQPKSLFGMIKNTYEANSQNVLSAYSDNAAVIRGGVGGRYFADPKGGTYAYHQEPIHSVIKVETHNHPTAVAPFPGAATGAGGEIRDEAATGRGAKPKMGLAGYSVSNLNIPGAGQPWEKHYGKPGRIASALSIILEAPIGAASYANEFGRPNLTGYFRTYEQQENEKVWGYHKPIMIAGGLGNIRDEHVQKQKLPVGAEIIVLGGPSMLIGLGGGAASSMQAGSSAEHLDFASVQRANAEIERKAQEVIDQCWALGKDNPIISIHDVGAGGLSNALTELAHDSNLGAEFELRAMPTAETGLSPLEIWCNESQERYVLGLSKENLNLFREICEREHCPFAVVGVTTKAQQLIVKDGLFGTKPIDMSMKALFGKPPRLTREVQSSPVKLRPLKLEEIKIGEAVKRVLNLPAVGSKKFLITIGDRSVGGLVVRDQMVGPWQVPVSDVAVTAASFDTDGGEAMAMGERTPLAMINPPASARMAIGEAITNIVAADIDALSDIKLSANWMAAAGFENEDEKLFKTVQAVGEEFCPKLGITIPVGKDSLSMRTVWQDEETQKSVTSPLSLIISAFSPVTDTSKTLTPQLDSTRDTSLILIDLGQGKNRLGGSALAQVYNQVGDASPDIDPELLGSFFKALRELKQNDKILAYHDRSDGGLLATLLEMAFASRLGLAIDIGKLPGSTLERLFNEELGGVIQVRRSDEDPVLKALSQALGSCVYVVGYPTQEQEVVIKDGQNVTFKESRAELELFWNETSHQLQKLRDNPECARQELATLSNNNDPGLSASKNIKLTTKSYVIKPKVAIFREQGVNGQIEMAAAFDRAGFTSVDVHLDDILAGRVSLDDFSGLAACGGFSYGDVLGAGEGWAKTILYNNELSGKFSKFFNRTNTFTLGVCNGCQMLSTLKQLIPGAEAWPRFLKNTSEQFESRLVMARINDSPSVFFKGMAGVCLPIPVAHGEGRTMFEDTNSAQQALANGLVSMQYVDNDLKVTEQYPANPNGSSKGITALTTADGRATIMMPHPERAFMARQLSWHPKDWGVDSPWLQIFQNAREWLDK